MSRQLLYSLLVLVGATLIAAVMIALRPEPDEEVRIEQPPLVEVVAFEQASGPIPVLGAGTVQAREEVTLASQVSGRLTYVHPQFRVGGTIPRGATLLRIDRSDYLNQVRIAEADVAAQRVAVLEAEEEVAIAREELDRFDVREAAAAPGGGNTRILPPRELERALARTGGSANGEQGARTGLATREPQLQSARAALDRAEANLADAKTGLARTRVTAPFGGLVRSGNPAVGQLVQPGEALGSLVASDAYEVRVSLTAEEAGLIPGLLDGSRSRVPASVTSEYGGRTWRWPAYVDRASAILDEATRNIEVFVRVPSPLRGGRLADEGGVADAPAGRAPPLLLGDFVDVEITGASLGSYAEVPADAVRPGNEIWLVRGGKLAIVKVRVIQRSDEIAYISTPSLADGGQLVTSSLTAPVEGMEVRVAPSNSAGAPRQ
ncbi:MAG: HlyD family efflux transporter periplasmic adaptor subunit [Erythrobacter sp.]|jgi:multidrug efflux pump subunit AcrA (membrane-fusion protein)|nr:HlyD family efflux transporter periplasmic adaptor subunit [Erythrobacter sp.]